MNKLSLAHRVDIHQHIWTEPLVAALAQRDSPPFARPANGRFPVLDALLSSRLARLRSRAGRRVTRVA